MGKGVGGAAVIHANRARKLKVQLDRVKAALVEAGFPVEDQDDEGIVRAVEILCEKVREQQRRIEDAEWEAAGR
jgi:isopropylmalate/homocitrate/citramalate synthase